MKELKEVLPGVLMVKVPKGTCGFFIYEWPDGTVGVYTNVESKKDWRKMLQKGFKYEIVGLVSECSEKVAADLIGKIYPTPPNEEQINFHLTSRYRSALKNLALSNGFTETDLIIKKIEG